jgi:ADP-ribose pyrophosphatase YjhB (NUDIX family)
MSSQANTSKPRPIVLRHGVKALVTAADRVLLVKETHSDGSSFWTLPGGGVESAESNAAALRRELAEELYCRARIESERATFWYAHASRENTVTRYTVFDCTLVSNPRPNETDGILAKRWADPTSLPPSTLLPVRHCLERRFD